MVRNNTGGSRHKKQARKNFTKNVTQVKTRLKNKKEPCEIYGIIVKNFGQGNCEVLCNDSVKRLCVIRNKFRGRNKRNNLVKVGIRVLVGLRDWEVRSNKSQERCDLLEVYNDRQLGDLKRDTNFNSELLRSEMEKGLNNKESDLFTFTNDIDAKDGGMVDNKIIEEPNELDDLDIDIDDI